MLKFIRHRPVGLESRRNRQGYTFLIHWIIGLVLFVLVPIFSSIGYAFSDVSLETGGISTKFTGLKYFKEILLEDPTYLNNVLSSLQQLVYTLPIILIISLVLAVILNQKFIGRTFARAIFFLPVILVASGLLQFMSAGGVVRGATMTISSGAEYTYGSIIDFKAMLSNVNMPSAITDIIAEYLTKVFSLIFHCGVQTVVFLAGLQSINPSLYEVSKIEGATKWEEFWFVTVPMLRHVISLVLVYTMIECCVESPAMSQAFSTLNANQRYSLSSAMAWFYFAIAILFMVTVLGLYNRFCMKRWE